MSVRRRPPAFLDPAKIAAMAAQRERERQAALADDLAGLTAEIDRADCEMRDAVPDALAAARARALALRVRRVRFLATALAGGDLRRAIDLAGRLGVYARSLAEGPEPFVRLDELAATLNAGGRP